MVVRNSLNELLFVIRENHDLCPTQDIDREKVLTENRRLAISERVSYGQ